MDEALPIGFQIANFTVRKFLAQGGFAFTYEIVDEEGGLWVAKELYPLDIAQRQSDGQVHYAGDEQTQAMRAIAEGNFRQELTALRKLALDTIPSYRDAISTNNTLYIIQEFIEGQALYQWAPTFHRMDTMRQRETLGYILRSLLVALGQVHEHGVLHRDVKPSNILIRQGTRTPVLIDFGAARFQVGGKTYNLDKRVFTPGYSSIEQVSQGMEQSQATDLYSLAATLLWLISGKEPPDARDRFSEDDRQRHFQCYADRYGDTLCTSLDWAFSVLPHRRPKNAKDWIHRIDFASPSPENCSRRWILGRSSEYADIAIPSASDQISRQQLIVSELSQGVYHLEDVSSNGSLIRNGSGEWVEVGDSYTIDSLDVQCDFSGVRCSLADLIPRLEYGPAQGSGTIAGVSNAEEVVVSRKDDVIAEDSGSQTGGNSDPGVETVNVSIASVVPATFGMRLAAYTFNAVVLVIFAFLYNLAVSIWSMGYSAQVDLSETQLDTVLIVLYFIQLLLGGVYFVYPWSKWGTDLGKKCVGLKVIDVRTDLPPSLGRSILRMVGYLVSTMVCFLGFFWMLWDREDRTWHDQLAMTKVVIDRQ